MVVAFLASYLSGPAGVQPVQRVQRVQRLARAVLLVLVLPLMLVLVLPVLLVLVLVLGVGGRVCAALALQLYVICGKRDPFENLKDDVAVEICRLIV